MEIVLDGGENCPLADALTTLVEAYHFDPRDSLGADTLDLLDALIVEVPEGRVGHPARHLLTELDCHHTRTCVMHAYEALRRGPGEDGSTLPEAEIHETERLAADIRRELVRQPIPVRVLTSPTELSAFYAEHEEGISSYGTVTAHATNARLDPEQPGLTWMAQQLVFYESLGDSDDVTTALLRPLATINTALLCQFGARLGALETTG